MGFQTTIIIRNDALGDIERNPSQFVQNLILAIQEISGVPEGLDVPCGHHGNVARVVECHHSDSTTIIASGGSTAELLATVNGWRWPDKQEKLSAFIIALVDAKVDAKVELQRKGKA
jgi:hypothetical protein